MAPHDLIYVLALGNLALPALLAPIATYWCPLQGGEGARALFGAFVAFSAAVAYTRLVLVPAYFAKGVSFAQGVPFGNLLTLILICECLASLAGIGAYFIVRRWRAA